ncbi:hypothetical protein ACFRFH_08850 [Leifsonia sp. NPDC056824]|uniref:hypothetical protein n=1 Tax=Leifsonia sp. NPDC056824 TaxID=3345953 RepID=UPI003684F605
MPRKKRTEPVALRIEDVHALVAAVNLTDIVLHEERGRRIYWTDSQRDELKFPITANSLGMREEGPEVRFRFRSVFSDERAEFVADVEAVYSADQEITVDEAVIREFAERVAFMAAYPFIRASIYSSASRLNVPAPVLGMVRQGEFSLGEKLTEDESQAAFGDTVSEFTGEADN